jgi:hypothetical protein
VRKYPAARDFSSIARTLLSNARSDGGNELIIAERTATAEDDATGQSRPQSQGVQGTADGRVAVNKIPTNRVVDNETPSESTQNAVRAYPKEQAEKLAKSTEETISGTPVSEYSDAALRKLSKQKDYAVEKEREELELKLRKLPKAGPGAVEVRRELEQKIKKLSKQKSLIAEKARRELKRRAPKPALALRIGTDWNKTQPVTVRDGVIYLGDDPAYDYETGDEVRIDETATPQQIADTLRAARAINNNEKFYGLAKAPKEDGPVFTEYEGNPEGAIERLMKEKAGEARAVVTREGLGEIDLVYGDEKHGLAKIADKHKGMLPKLAGLLRSGRVVKLEGNAKRYIVAVGSPPQIAIVALDYNGQTKTWVVTSYEDAKGNTYRNLMENGVTVTTMDTDGTTVADDTARRNNAVDQSLAPSTEKSSAPQSRPPKGRAQPLTAQVLTPSGYRLMGDIRVGDAVIAADGSLSEVTGVFPQGRKPIYRITLSDGSTTRSTLDHLWKVRGEDEEGYKVLPLSEIMDAMARGSRFEIPPLGTGGSFNFASDNPDLLLDLEGMAFKRGMGVR